ncbi:phytoene/squalene synthase family protein [Stigmatella erecta]|uniref:Farnesyl-diphosphate farnesyltransferase n=1 Tax=Stigmatella erecta TaxID=83460 RepID=A0A1I0K6G7_9BACT|nr:phytoene/squalene synthase family protein [Stigmatella erecta]SEU18634.1 farnesyl-diphosphate farnesyltransferase [Stigmatella erecta]
MSNPEAFCREALPEVSRTFALNIPVLPEPLDLVVTVGYLLCRIVDTIEDEATCSAAQRAQLLSRFAHFVELPEGWRHEVPRYIAEVEQWLRPSVPAPEARLLRRTGTVLETFAALPRWTQPPIVRCVRAMADGMGDVSRQLELVPPASGLKDLEATLTYCYYVAGTVGEMLTDLFIGFAPQLAPQGETLRALAPAFGRALQLINILKDVREDLERGYCWLPQTLMSAHGLTAPTLLKPENRGRAVAMHNELIAVARREADISLEYALRLPVEEPGLRLFCLLPLFFAVLTLSRLENNPAVFEPTPVKISRASVQEIILLTQRNVASDPALRAIYQQCLSGALQPEALTS